MKDPTPHNPTRLFYDRISRAYDLLAEASEHDSRQRGLELLAVKPGETVLEVGYGTGHSLVTLAEAAGDEGAVYGIDLSPGMREVTRKRLAEAGAEGRIAALDVGDARHLPYDDESFDAAAMSFTLELFEPAEIPGVLAELRRVLRPGGRLAVVALDDHDTARAMVDFYKWFHRHFPHIVDCQPIPVVSVLEASGFRVDKREEMSIWGLPVAVVVAFG